MAHSTLSILGIPVKQNTPKYFFLLAAKKLGLTVQTFGNIPRREKGVLTERNILQITDGVKYFLTLGATTSRTSYLGMKVAVNKAATNTLLKKFGIPTTEQIAIHSEKDLNTALLRFGKIIMKPATSCAGKGVFSNIQSLSKAKSVYTTLKKKYQNIVAEKIIEGNEYRVLVINGKVFAVAEYIPPSIIGDGTNTLLSLIQAENTKRAIGGHETPIKISSALRLNLKDIGLSLQSILPKGAPAILHKAAPISNGGHAIDVTEKIHKTNTLIAEQVATLINIDIAGIDIITPSIDQPLDTTGGAIIEINGGPDLDVHFSPHTGKSRNGAEQVLKDYFGL